MRILVVADIHGNRAALEAIREPHDLCVCIGDLVDYGPEPAACIDWVRANAAYCVRGNHDHGVAQQVQIQGVNGFRYLTAATRPVSIASIAPDQRRFLAEMPTTRLFTAAGKRFLLVHATPRDPMDEYAPAEPQFWAPRLARLAVDFVLVGHTHIPYTLAMNGITVVNPGSVGLSRDGNPQASYAVIEDGVATLKRASYAIEETVAATEEVVSDLPARQMLVNIFRNGSHINRPFRVNGSHAGSNGYHSNNGNGNGNGNGAAKPESEAAPAQEP